MSSNIGFECSKEYHKIIWIAAAVLLVYMAIEVFLFLEKPFEEFPFTRFAVICLTILIIGWRSSILFCQRRIKQIARNNNKNIIDVKNIELSIKKKANADFAKEAAVVAAGTFICYLILKK